LLRERRRGIPIREPLLNEKGGGGRAPISFSKRGGNDLPLWNAERGGKFQIESQHVPLWGGKNDGSWKKRPLGKRRKKRPRLGGKKGEGSEIPKGD